VLSVNEEDRFVDQVTTLEEISESRDGLKLVVNASRDVELVMDGEPPVARGVSGTDTLAWPEPRSRGESPIGSKPERQRRG
jgi:hypothetical protein